MFKNYIVVTLRNLRRNKGYSFINILRLALSLGLGLLLIQMIASFTSFDEFQASKDRIFRVITTRTGGDEAKDFATAPFPLAPALREPNSIVLAADVAERFFGGGDPVGEVIQLGKWGDYRVTGVLEDMTRLKTHIEGASFISLSTIPALEGRKLLTPRSASWTDLYGAYGYVLLRPGTSPRQVEEAANRLAAGCIHDDKYAYRFRLQELTRIANGPKMANNTINSVPMAAVYVLAAVAGLVVLSAAFNYTNLSIARALSRGREVGIRKVVGAGDWTLVRLLSRGYLAMLAVSSVAAIPVAWGFNKLILSLYDKAVSQRAELFLAGVAIVGALGLTTVLSQTVRAARVNPADIIRHE